MRDCKRNMSSKKNIKYLIFAKKWATLLNENYINLKYTVAANKFMIKKFYITVYKITIFLFKKTTSIFFFSVNPVHLYFLDLDSFVSTQTWKGKVNFIFAVSDSKILESYSIDYNILPCMQETEKSNELGLYCVTREIKCNFT